MKHRGAWISGKQSTLASRVVAAWLILVLAMASSIAVADMPDTSDLPREQQRAALLNQMRTLAQGTKIRCQKSDRQPKLVAWPVLRYDDQPRRFLDATLWVWIDAGRPVGFEKIEATVFDRPRWQHCFTSVAEQLLEVEWSKGRHFRSTEPGAIFQPLPDAPMLATRDRARKLQARQLARDFSARTLLDLATNESCEMRLLSTPIYEYVDPATNAFRGAVFGLAANGSNPDMLLLLEACDKPSQVGWHYAAVRMTNGGVTLQYRQKTVYEAEFVAPRAASFATWTFFNTLRDDGTQVDAR